MRTCRAILLISAPYNNYHTFGLSYSVRIVWLHTSNTLIFNSSPHSSPLFIPPSLHFFLNPSCRQSPAIPSKDYTSYCDDPMCLSPGKNNHTTTDTLTAVLAPNKSPVLNQWNKIHVQCVSSWFYYQHRNHKFKNIPFSAAKGYICWTVLCVPPSQACTVFPLKSTQAKRLLVPRSLLTRKPVTLPLSLWWDNNFI